MRSKLAALLALTGAGLITSGILAASPPAAAPLPPRTFDEPAPAAAPHSPTPSAPPTLGPDTLAIPAVGIDALLVPEPTVQGVLSLPTDIHQVGIWTGGAEPTATTGTITLAGHVDRAGQGPGALATLADLHFHDTVYLRGTSGPTTRWQITALDVVPKAKLPATVFAGTRGTRRLIIVTCGGPVEHIPGYGASYRDNVIATAQPAP